GALDLGLGQEIAELHAVLELGNLQRAAQLTFVLGRAHADLRQHALGGNVVELAVDLEGRLALVGADDRIIVDTKAALGGALAHQGLVGVLIEQLILQLRAHGGRDIGARLLLVLRLALLPGLLQGGGRDLLAVDLEAVLRRTEGQVHDPVGSPEGKNQDQQSQYQEGQPALALEDVTDVLQHTLRMAERTGLEPATPGVTGRYSSQLKYRSAVIGWC